MIEKPPKQKVKFMQCRSCGIVQTFGAIRSHYPAFFTCCDERNMMEITAENPLQQRTEENAI